MPLSFSSLNFPNSCLPNLSVDIAATNAAKIFLMPSINSERLHAPVNTSAPRDTKSTDASRTTKLSLCEKGLHENFLGRKFSDLWYVSHNLSCKFLQNAHVHTLSTN